MSIRIHPMPRDLRLLIVLATILVLGRIAIFNTTHYVYLLWNIFLAMIPLGISSMVLLYTEKHDAKHFVVAIGCIVWLATFPNAPYLVTDLIHLGRGYMGTILYDTMLLFTVGWLGLLIAFYSLSHMEKVLRAYMSHKMMLFFRGCIILLASFGMYLGRFVRFNSWDIVIHPLQLFSHIWNIFSDPLTYLQSYVFTVTAFIFIYVMYIAWQYRTPPRV